MPKNDTPQVAEQPAEQKQSQVASKPFSQASIEHLKSAIEKMGAEVDAPWIGFPFMTIEPKAKAMQLKVQYKPLSAVAGVFTEYNEGKRADKEYVEKARKKLRENHFHGDYYDNGNGAFKLHLSLNNLADLDQNIILDLIQFLINEADAPGNNLAFHFKLIDPEKCSSPRFSMNDQITLYFDKYSSAQALRQFAQKIDQFLKARSIPENKQALGPKDSFGFNSFISARFDANKLTREYDVYKFFDVELKKFFEKHNDQELENLPICALDAVFNSVITSDEIKSLKKAAELSPEDSAKVQLEFNKMLANPLRYLGANPVRVSPPIVESKVEPSRSSSKPHQAPPIQAPIQEPALGPLLSQNEAKTAKPAEAQQAAREAAEAKRQAHNAWSEANEAQESVNSLQSKLNRPENYAVIIPLHMGFHTQYTPMVNQQMMRNDESRLSDARNRLSQKRSAASNATEHADSLHIQATRLANAAATARTELNAKPQQQNSASTAPKAPEAEKQAELERQKALELEKQKAAKLAEDKVAKLELEAQEAEAAEAQRQTQKTKRENIIMMSPNEITAIFEQHLHVEIDYSQTSSLNKPDTKNKLLSQLAEAINNQANNPAPQRLANVRFFLYAYEDSIQDKFNIQSNSLMAAIIGFMNDQKLKLKLLAEEQQRKLTGIENQKASELSEATVAKLESDAQIAAADATEAQSQAQRATAIHEDIKRLCDSLDIKLDRPENSATRVNLRIRLSKRMIDADIAKHLAESTHEKAKQLAKAATTARAKLNSMNAPRSSASIAPKMTEAEKLRLAAIAESQRLAAEAEKQRNAAAAGKLPAPKEQANPAKPPKPEAPKPQNLPNREQAVINLYQQQENIGFFAKLARGLKAIGMFIYSLITTGSLKAYRQWQINEEPVIRMTENQFNTAGIYQINSFKSAANEVQSPSIFHHTDSKGNRFVFLDRRRAERKGQENHESQAAAFAAQEPKVSVSVRC